mgnify:CR=1 FL=1
MRRQLENGSVLSMASPPPTDISLVIPVSNGADFVADTVASSRNFLAGRRLSFEIIVVDDGSTDGSAAAIRPLTDESVRLIELSTNRGKFGALKVGMAEAHGACRIFTDADLPFDIEAIPYIAELVNERGFHVVVGDRTLPESCSATETRLSRRLSSRVFSFCVRMLVTGGLFDSQCGLCLLYTSDAADEYNPV